MEAAFIKLLPGVEFLSASFACFGIFLLLFYLLRQHQLSKQLLVNIPPGPKPLPVVGNFGSLLVPPFILRLFVQKAEEYEKKRTSPLSPQVGLTQLSKIYGNIYSLFVGSQLVVVLNGYELIRDALSNHPEAFSDRPDIPLVTILTKRKGFSYVNYALPPQTLKCSPNNYLTHTWWNPIFNFLERNVQSQVPCSFCWPLTWPPACLKNPCKKYSMVQSVREE